MKIYKWVKPYTYTKVPVYLINWHFHFFGCRSVSLIQTGYKKRRTGMKMTKDEMWKIYSDIKLAERGDSPTL